MVTIPQLSVDIASKSRAVTIHLPHYIISMSLEQKPTRT